MASFCSKIKRSLYRELYDVTVHGKVGSYDVAYRMPTELRRFWLQQVVEDRKTPEEEELEARFGR